MLWLYNLMLQFITGFLNIEEYPEAETVYGKVRGQHKYSYKKRIYSAFEGIPFAKPPVGDLRFEEPQDPDGWDGILEATKVHICTQPEKFRGVAIGEEDCLYLNVYVPRKNPIPYENLDVIVHVHGGGFTAGGTFTAGPKYLMDRDIVYINVNYRLSVFGFLSTGDNVISGNLGYKDQIHALKWIKNNIPFFGGNPNSVTLVGVSSGGVCVHFHYFSPLSKGLYHRGISTSGSALSTWAIQVKPLENVFKLGRNVGCNNTHTKKLVKCLKTIPQSELINSMYVLYYLPGVPLTVLTTVIEKESKSAFLTDEPYQMLMKNQVQDIPWLATTTTAEGSDGLPIFNFTLDKFKNDFDNILPYLLNYYDRALEDDKPIITKKIKQFYFRNGEINDERFVKLMGDRFFYIPIETAIRIQSNVTKSPVYTYMYDYKNSFRSKMWFKMLTKGVGHTEDAALIYNNSLDAYEVVPEKLSDSDEVIKDALLDIIVSFAKDGVPKYKDIVWKPVTNNIQVDALFIKDPYRIVMKKVKPSRGTTFWSSLPIKELNKL